MNKPKKTALIRTSKTPPPKWPSEKQWSEVKKKLAKSLPTKILNENCSPVERVKYDLCEYFVKYIRTEGISQRDLAKQLNTTESRVSEILHYHIECFTIDKLLTLLNKIRPEIGIRVA